MQTKKTAPFGIPNNTQQGLRPIISLTKSNYKLLECPCALARQKQRSPAYAGFLAALFFVSFFWASKRKKRKPTVNCRLITDDEIILFL